ncbi:MAG: type II toxin-antitoxin system VapC family toxin [Proteobacteria bacterium]|nr:type II toxin-antitoxin system VapC family toxin [Pseudomonadota bacterium]
MTGWLLDTNVISELRKRGCDPKVKRWTEAQRPEALFLSTVTIAEIRFGIERAADARFRTELLDWLETVLLGWFDGRVLEITESVMLEWRRMVERGRAMRHTFSQPDLLIAATAAVNGLAVATRNVADFEKAGVLVLNPWREA